MNWWKYPFNASCYGMDRLTTIFIIGAKDSSSFGVTALHGYFHTSAATATHHIFLCRFAPSRIPKTFIYQVEYMRNIRLSHSATDTLWPHLHMLQSLYGVNYCPEHCLHVKQWLVLCLIWWHYCTKGVPVCTACVALYCRSSGWVLSAHLTQ